MKKQFKKIGSLLVPLLMFFVYSGFGQLTVTPVVTPACTDSSGAVTFFVSSGTGYTYQVVNMANYSYLTQTDSVFTNLPVGNYYVDIYGGPDSGWAYFSITPAITISSLITNTVCPADTGSIAATPGGGTAPYTYLWSNSATTATVTGLSGAIYSVTVHDAVGCSVSQSDTVYSISSMTLSIADTGAACNPYLTANVTGGSGSYTYYWNTGGTTRTISGLTGSQTFDVTVTDAGNGCTATQNLYVNATSLQIDTSNLAVTNPTCAGNNGSITVEMYNGTPPYSYNWTGTPTTDSVYSGLAAGDYTVTVSDANGCTGTYTYYLYTNQISAFASASNPACGQSNGAMAIYAYGGSGSYTYVWSPGGSGQSSTNLPAGYYSVTVSDGTGCSATVSQALPGVGSYTVTLSTTPTACDTALHTGTATAIISGGGNPPFNFAWYAQTYLGNTQTIGNLPAGTVVSLAMTDALGCIAANADPSDSEVTGYDSLGIAFDPACYDQITGYVFLDANGNCILDSGETGLSNAYVLANGANGLIYYANPDSTGYYDIPVLPGIYTVTVNVYNTDCMGSQCASLYIDTFTTGGQAVSGDNFGFQSGSDFDLGVHPGCTTAVPGGTKDYWVYYFNNGLAAANNAVVSFTHDSTLTLLSTNPPYTSYDAVTHLITWNVGTVLPTGSWTLITMEFSVPANLALGSTLYAQAEIDPITGDCNPSDNIVNISNVVSASHDPNFKEVSPAGDLSAGDTVLTYTINFQNTGNAPANTIVIKDTLSPNVNPATVRPGASSFPGYRFSISGNGILTFTFQGINLPDSTANPQGSEGFVTYTVHTKPGLPIGSQINNTGYVYFDANPAVATNTTTNTRSNGLGIGNVTNSIMSAIVIPNPASDQALISFTGATGTIAIQITDALGEAIAKTNTDGKVYTLDAASLAPGIYFYTAIDANGHKASGKISVVH